MTLGTAQELFTASEVARFCQVDLKTIHNWAERGEIPHFRTPGRHLRFRRHDVLHFLRKYGYPMPMQMLSERPRVVAIVSAPTTSEVLHDTLDASFDVSTFEDPYAALLQIGAEPPDAVVVDGICGEHRAVAVIDAIKRTEATTHVRAILFTAETTDKEAALRVGASAQVCSTDFSGLRDTLHALMGTRR